MKQHATGIEYWRSLEQLADTPEVREMISQEFPGYDADTIATESRRSFLKLMGASMAMAGIGLTGCRRVPKETIAPYAAAVRDRIPGVPEQYATAFELGGVASGLLVTSYDGRPIKVEGNPSHPFAWTIKDKIGAASAFAQASILELYDPERSRSVIDRTSGKGVASSWADFMAAAKPVFDAFRTKGSELAILAEPMSGPSAEQMRERLRMRENFPRARWYEYEPLSRDAELEGSKLAFGQAVRPVLHLDKAKVVVSLDADLLGTHPAHIRYASDWSSQRRSADDKHEMNRVYAAESGFSITGSVADERLGVTPGRIYPIARAIAARLGVAGITSDEKLSAAESRFADVAAADLKQAGAAGVMSAGCSASPAVHALAFAINQQIGAVGQSVTLVADPAGDRTTHFQAIADLVKEITDPASKITTLLILGGNPVYDAPADLDFAKALAKLPLSIHLSLYDDETSTRCKWHLPRAHYLEAWGDARAWDGTATLAQPLIEPLFGGKSIIEMLGLFDGDEPSSGSQIVRRVWQELVKGDIDLEFRRALEAGFLAGTAYETAKVELKLAAASLPPVEPAPPAGTLYLRFDADAHTYDGRFANNGWLQETPEPLSKLMWDNALILSKKDGDALGVVTSDLVNVEVSGRSMKVPAYLLPGQPAGVACLSLGYGRTAAGHIGNETGFNAYPLRTTQTPYVAAGAKVSKADGTYSLVSTQSYYIIDKLGAESRDERIGEKGKSGEIIREGTLADYKANPQFARRGGKSLTLQLFESPNTFTDPHAWGMSVDLATCIGCNACVVACQSENNIPIVGKTEAANHRQMHWIRIDRYFKGESQGDDVEVIFQPVMCQHCENAPCEQVCPVAATVHDTEGLNTMVYNRCIGTRYCANNCPYKVRRFNYFDFHAKDPKDKIAMPFPGIPDAQQDTVDKIKRMVFNPEATVRMRGVMEKCTYCVQRIHNTTTTKRAHGQEIADGDVVTACQQTCPTNAIVFGNLNDKTAAVTQLHGSPRSYDLLGELNTRPRTRYLAKVWNPAGENAGEGAAPAATHPA